MALKFYLDTPIAKAVAEQLRFNGVDVVRCEEVGLAEASDESHLVYAAQEQPIQVSQDADFTILAAKWRDKGRFHPGIMKIPSELQGAAQTRFLVQQLLFYHNAEPAGALEYIREIGTHVIYL